MPFTEDEKKFALIIILVIVVLYIYGLYNAREGYQRVTGIPRGGSYGQVQNEIYQWPYPSPLDFSNLPRRYAKYLRDGRLVSISYVDPRVDDNRDCKVVENPPALADQNVVTMVCQ